MTQSLDVQRFKCQKLTPVKSSTLSFVYGCTEQDIMVHALQNARELKLVAMPTEVLALVGLKVHLSEASASPL